uniref:Uncharacterized protein n=1 Tax=Triticum urartu TaxID=4572 RepID=A0A8R7TNR5_TRIUA
MLKISSFFFRVKSTPYKFDCRRNKGDHHATEDSVAVGAEAYCRPHGSGGAAQARRPHHDAAIFLRVIASWS